MIAAKTPKQFKAAPSTWTKKEVDDNVEWLKEFANRQFKKRDERYERINSETDKRGGK